MADWNEFKQQELRQSEKNLKRLIEKNALLVRKLEEAQDEIERAHDQIAEQLKVIDEYKGKIARLEGKSKSSEKELEKPLSSRRSFDEKDKKFEDLYQNIKNKDRVIETLTSNQIFSQEKLEELRNELENKNRDMEILQKKLKSTEKSIDTLFLNQKTEGEFVSELEHFRVDNQRLLNLLGKSKEYKFLGQFIEESNGAHYIQSHKPQIDETMNWVPSQVSKVLEIYKKAEITDEILSTLLLEINKSFREREKNIVMKLKNSYKNKIGELKRQLLMRQPYDSIKAQKQNSRLKSELKKANTEITMISGKQTNLIPKMQDLEETFRVLGSLRAQNTQLQKENTELKRNKAAKSQFLEGVGWLGEKVMKQKSQMHNLISDLIRNFEFDGEASKAKQEWLLVRDI